MAWLAMLPLLLCCVVRISTVELQADMSRKPASAFIAQKTMNLPPSAKHSRFSGAA